MDILAKKNREGGANTIDINLFAGAGGLAVGLATAGFAPLHLYEVDEHACETLRSNIDARSGKLAGRVHCGDIRNVDWRSMKGPVRLIAAGVPCQPFSLGGKHRAHADERNMFPEAFRAIRELNPAAVLIENVRGLLRNSFQPYFEYILRQLECPSLKPKAGEDWIAHDKRIRRYQCSSTYEHEYQVSWRLVDAADYGVPQNRLRIFIIATKIGLPRYCFPLPTHSPLKLIESMECGEYWDRNRLSRSRALCTRRGQRRAEYRQLELVRENSIRGDLPWGTVRDAFYGLGEPAEDESAAAFNHWRIPGARRYHGHSGSVLDWPSKTLKAGVHGVPGGENTVTEDCGKIRYYTLREMARLQTFPDVHLFYGARIHVTRQIGNAVPCRLAAAIASPLFELVSPAKVDDGPADYKPAYSAGVRPSA